MTDLIYDYITMGVDMMISAAILAAIIVMLRSSNILTNYSAQQQATSDRLNYYKEFVAFDNTSKLLSPDISSAMVYYRYDLDIVVKMGDVLLQNDRHSGKFYVEGGSYGARHEVPYNTPNVGEESVISIVGTNKKFTAFLVEDFNDTPSTSGYMGGTITGLKFEQYP